MLRTCYALLAAVLAALALRALIPGPLPPRGAGAGAAASAGARPPDPARARPGGPAVALTFDDGPDPRFTPAVLRILHDHQARATFFVLGEEAQRHPSLVQQEARLGHEVANHGWRHLDSCRLRPEELRRNVERAAALIAALTGRRPALFRPPYGACAGRALPAARAAGEQVVLWHVALEHADAATPGEMARRALRLVRPGDIILAHDGRLDRRRTLAALTPLLRGLAARGLRVVPVSELLHGATGDRRTGPPGG